MYRKQTRYKIRIKNENITIFPTEKNAIQELNNIFMALSKGSTSYVVNGDRVGS